MDQSQQITPFQVLKVKVYPVINTVILKLIDHIVKSQQVSKHEQRLKKKKLLDELERKYLQREIQKEELGSDYEESDDQEYYKKLEMKRQDVESIIVKRIQKNNVKNSSDEQHDNQLQELGQNVFNPIQFIINELKHYQTLKAQGKLSEFQQKSMAKNRSIQQNIDQPVKIQNYQ